jgi:hypothetical protein
MPEVTSDPNDDFLKTALQLRAKPNLQYKSMGFVVNFDGMFNIHPRCINSNGDKCTTGGIQKTIGVQSRRTRGSES